MRLLFFFLPALLFLACGTPALHEQPTLIVENLEEETEGALQVVVETPAGSVTALRYDAESKRFFADPSGKITFLPYPVNWGFVPSTRLPHLAETAFAPVEALILGDRLESGDVVSVSLIGAVILEENGNRSILALAVPVDPALRNLDIRDYSDLVIRYPGVKENLEQWLRLRNGPASAKVLDWKDEQYAMRFIAASTLKNE
jgi:inorganic pyrophosphatase